MRSELLRTSTLVAVSLLGACVTVSKPPVQETRTVGSGARSQIAYFYYLGKDCQPQGVPQVTVTTAPANGTVSIGAGDHLPQYAAGNAGAACNQQPVQSAEVYYQSSESFRGADSFSIAVRYSSSYTQAYTYGVTVN
jgi:hypothetical protein